MKNRRFGRRGVLKGATATAALLGAARASLPAGAFAQAAGPETNKVTLGFIALTDAAPLIIAKEKGLFAKYGMPDVEVAKQASWGATRDNLVLGSGGGRHRRRAYPDADALPDLAGKVTAEQQADADVYPGAAQLRLPGASRSPRNSRAAAPGSTPRRSRKPSPRRRRPARKSRCAMTFPGGTHDLWIRYWLAAGGIDPDKDVSTIVVPPPQMVANMKVGNMDAFCVGEPWNEQLVNQDIGFTACMTGEIWKDHPEKALGMRADWVDKNPKAAHGRADGRHGGPAMVREDGEQGRAWPPSSASANGSTCRRPTSSTASRATSTTATAARSTAPTC